MGLGCYEIGKSDHDLATLLKLTFNPNTETESLKAIGRPYCQKDLLLASKLPASSPATR